MSRLARCFLTGLVLGLLACGGGGSTSDTVVDEPLRVEPLANTREPVQLVVASGDTIESICRQLAGDDWVKWRDALSGQIDPRRLRPGMKFEGQRDPAGRLEQLRANLDLRVGVELSLAEGVVEASRIERPIESEIVRLQGRIDSSLFAAVEEAGGEPDLAVRLAEIFQWDIDFFRDLRQGDHFVAIVDRQTVGTRFYAYGNVFAARFVNDGRILNAVAYPDGKDRIGYFDLEGNPLRKQFLRSPLKFSRITSRFSMRRFHPVLKRRMPHYGVDYGAPSGTPAHATADGKVTFVGRNGGAGRMVTVRHTNGYETSYLHLRGYGKGIRRGARVTQGQVIGYVGSSGLSTGPHLDYRVKLNGRYINPLTISAPAAEPLPEAKLPRFLSHALAVLELLEGREPPDGAAC